MPEQASTSQLDRLLALRSAQEAAMADGVATRDFAALSREYRATLAEIASLEPKEPAGDGIDEIARRRATRRASPAAGEGRAKRTS